MNYEGLTTLRADIAALANRMCYIRAEMNALEAACRFDSGTAGADVPRG